MAPKIVSSIEHTAPAVGSIEPMAEANGEILDNSNTGVPRLAQRFTPEKTPDRKKRTTSGKKVKSSKEKKLKVSDNPTAQTTGALQARANAQLESNNIQVDFLAPLETDATPPRSIPDSDVQTNNSIEAPRQLAGVQSESTAIQTGTSTQALPIGPAANDDSFTHSIRPLKPGDLAPRQAPKNCWDHLGSFPQSGHRAAWLPYVEALGLTLNEFPEIRVDGKKPQAVRGNKQKTPSWGFLLYVLIAVSPEGKLQQNEAYNLSLAWCTAISATNQTCRKALSQEDEFRSTKPFHRLASVDEKTKDCVLKKMGPAKSKAGATRKTTSKGNSGKNSSQTGSSAKKIASKSNSQSSTLQSSSSFSSNNPQRRDSAWNPVNGNSTTESSNTLHDSSSSPTGRPSRKRKRPARYQDERSSESGEEEQVNGSPASQPPQKRIRFTSQTQILLGSKSTSDEDQTAALASQKALPLARDQTSSSSSSDEVRHSSASDRAQNGDTSPQTAASPERNEAISSLSTDERSDEYGSYSNNDPTYGSGVRMRDAYPHGTHSKLSLYFSRLKRAEDEARAEAAAKAEAAFKRLADARQAMWKAEGYAAVEPPANGENFRVSSAKNAGIQTPLKRGKKEVTPGQYIEDVLKSARSNVEMGKQLAEDLEVRFFGKKVKGMKRSRRDAIMIERLNESSRAYLGSPETKLQPYEQFSMSNPMGEQFLESNVRGAS